MRREKEVSFLYGFLYVLILLTKGNCVLFCFFKKKHFYSTLER